MLHVLYVFGDYELLGMAKSSRLTLLNSPGIHRGQLKRVEAQNEGHLISFPAMHPGEGAV